MGVRGAKIQGIQTVSVFITIVSPKPSAGSGTELIHNRYWEGGREGRQEGGKEGDEERKATHMVW